MALTPVDNPAIYGVVETDAGGMVKRFVENQACTRLAARDFGIGYEGYTD